MKVDSILKKANRQIPRNIRLLLWEIQIAFRSHRPIWEWSRSLITAPLVQHRRSITSSSCSYHQAELINKYQINPTVWGSFLCAECEYCGYLSHRRRDVGSREICRLSVLTGRLETPTHSEEKSFPSLCYFWLQMWFFSAQLLISDWEMFARRGSDCVILQMKTHHSP